MPSAAVVGQATGEATRCASLAEGCAAIVEVYAVVARNAVIVKIDPVHIEATTIDRVNLHLLFVLVIAFCSGHRRALVIMFQRSRLAAARSTGYPRIIYLEMNCCLA